MRGRKPKFNLDEVEDIRQKYFKDKKAVYELCAEYKCSYLTLRNVLDLTGTYAVYKVA